MSAWHKNLEACVIHRLSAINGDTLTLTYEELFRDCQGCVNYRKEGDRWVHTKVTRAAMKKALTKLVDSGKINNIADKYSLLEGNNWYKNEELRESFATSST